MTNQVPTLIDESGHVVAHGSVRPIDQAVVTREPTMTLCDLRVFRGHAGTAAATTLQARLELGALDSTIAAIQRDRRLTMRISVYVLWLATDQVPSSRYDWHIDRIGGIEGHGTAERYDAADYTGCRSFAVVSVFLPAFDAGGRAVDAASTEFIRSPSPIRLPNRWMYTEEVDTHIKALLAGGHQSAHCGDRVATSFSARAVHRPGFAPGPGWRFFMRIGAYLSNPARPRTRITSPRSTRSAPKV